MIKKCKLFVKWKRLKSTWRRSMSTLVLLASALGTCGISEIPAAEQTPGGLTPMPSPIPAFTLPEDLQISLFASESAIRNPMSCDIDESGRVWVLEGVKSSAPLSAMPGLQGKRILVLEDTDRDGLADKQTVFYEDSSLNGARRICVVGGQVFVSGSPNILVLTDIDHDGKADKREILFTGIDGRDGAGAGAVVFGPDGKLYLSLGHDGKRLKHPLRKECALHGELGEIAAQLCTDAAGNEIETSGRPDRHGMVFRCNLDGTEVEPVAWNFQSAPAMALDSFGTFWGGDCDDKLPGRGGRITEVLPGGNYGDVDERTGSTWETVWNRAHAQGVAESERPLFFWHQSDPGILPEVIALPNGSPVSLLVYEGRTLPRRFWNQLFVCDARGHTVRACRLTANGARYSAETEEILGTRAAGFDPLALAVAPDGSLYVVVGNPVGEADDPRGPGRIYRVAKKGIGPSIPPQDWATPHGWVGALQSANPATRALAWLRLHAAGESAERYLLMLSRSNDSYYKARALQLLARIKGSEEKYISKCLLDTNPIVRVEGVRIACQAKRDLMPLVTQLRHDSAPLVRRECLIALRHSVATEAPQLWADLAFQYQGQDRWYLEALGIGADGQWDRYLDVWLAQVGQDWNSSTGREIVWRSRSQKTPSLLKRLVNDSGTSIAERARYLRALEMLTGSVGKSGGEQLPISKSLEAN